MATLGVVQARLRTCQPALSANTRRNLRLKFLCGGEGVRLIMSDYCGTDCPSPPPTSLGPQATVVQKEASRVRRGQEKVDGRAKGRDATATGEL